ncbi:hypothetical protein CANTEDRAFT_125746 [Yamadazyma tenuis ATCC 10573]|nr:uncharacterized protein CANTEDRAFT_125746 [Yamadazyma tenuis ATCC 10573]EGV62151.1 hypothetical protein CANTEDRAFT_125746 [Yamadazyma tenuis ATCC 10573]
MGGYLEKDHGDNGVVTKGIVKSGQSVLYRKILEYFQSTLQSSYDQIMKLVSNPVLEVDEALSLILGNIFFFCFLFSQPFGFLPLYSPNDEPDIVGFVGNLRWAFIPSFYALEHGEFNKVLVFCELRPPKDADEFYGYYVFSDYPIVAELNRQLKQCFKDGTVSEPEFFSYRATLQKLDRSFLAMVDNNLASCIFRWLFMFRESVFGFIREGKFFAHKLLFYYSCLSYWTGIMGVRGTGVGAGLKCPVIEDYLQYYRQYIFTRFGKWDDPRDEASYNLVIKYRYVLSLVDVKNVVEFRPEVALRAIEQLENSGGDVQAFTKPEQTVY